MIDSKRLTENCLRIREAVAEAAERSGRAADAVRIVAVTKYAGPDALPAIAAAGCLDLGESRPQELLAKADAAAELSLDVRWHMIGHLQRNKARKLLPRIDWMHSIDSLRLLETVDRLAAEAETPPRCLLEVNISGDDEKHGFAPDEMPRVIASLQGRRLPVVGLMAMAARDGGAEVARRNFAALRELRDRLRGECPEHVKLDELSMGMSGDWPQAVIEGATIVRIGSALFEGS